MVTRKRNGTKTQRSGGSTVVHDNWRGVGYQSKDRVEWRDGKPSGNEVGHVGPQREAKRKLSPLRVVEKAQLERVIQSVSKVDKEKAQAQLGLYRGEAKGILVSPSSLKPNTRDTIRGKKAHSCARAHLQVSGSTVGRAQVKSVQASEEKINQNGGAHTEIFAEFQFAAPGQLEMEHEFGRRVCRDIGEQGMSNAVHRVVRRHVEKGVEDGEQANMEGDSSALPDSGFQSSCARPSDRNGSSATIYDADATDRMEFEQCWW